MANVRPFKVLSIVTLAKLQKGSVGASEVSLRKVRSSIFMRSLSNFMIRSCAPCLLVSLLGSGDDGGATGVKEGEDSLYCELGLLA